MRVTRAAPSIAEVLLGVALCCLGSSGVACAPDGPSARGPANSVGDAQAVPTLVERLAEEPNDVAGVCSFGSGVPVWSTSTHRQRLYVSTGPDGSEVTVVDGHRGAPSGEWSFISHAAVSTLPFSGVASARADRFAFAGRDAEGAITVEEWRLVVGRDGAADTADIADPADTTDLADTADTADTAAEATRSSPEVARPAKHFERRTLGTAPRAGGVVAMDFDAEARFVLALLRVGEARVLYRFENRPGAVPAVLAHSDELPELARMTSLQKLQHRRFGRVWLLDEDPLSQGLRIAFIDAENDGEFDGPPRVGSARDFAEAGFDGYEQYQSLLRPTER